MQLHQRRALAGFSLVETMMAIAVMVILATIAVPSFREAALSSQLKASATNLAAATYFARGEALKRNAVVTLCMSADGSTCATSGGWEQGWRVAVGGTTLQTQAAAPSGLKITAGGLTTLSFQPTAVGATAATFIVCRATPTAGREEREVRIDASGRPWVQRTTNAVCP